MTKSLAPFALLAAAALLPANATPANATPGGQIGTLQHGTYVCELPGDATGPAGVTQDGEGFTVVNASSYRTPAGRGTYLLTGDLVTLTSGPRKGEKYHKLSGNFLRRMNPDGTDSDLRCVRKVENNR
ncbi:hypothetical protein [Novosphingobium sp.]|uniref:hypothetical protein n=1 Tax=Novosphingobium sp. TaxID=1874826 RepID=UPI002736F8CB|nr:hypothetical protein [Novosphingobium sp.]MDP3907174.1 hypothetical protein [Novosphingobium sp.]